MKPKMSYAEIISQAQLMAAGLKTKQAEVARRGIDANFVAELEAARTEAIVLNDDQERLKAELKTKTDALNTKIDSILAKLSEARKVVKLSIPQTGWREFGIEDKR